MGSLLITRQVSRRSQALGGDSVKAAQDTGCARAGGDMSSDTGANLLQEKTLQVL